MRWNLYNFWEKQSGNRFHGRYESPPSPLWYSSDGFIWGLLRRMKMISCISSGVLVGIGIAQYNNEGEIAVWVFGFEWITPAILLEIFNFSLKATIHICYLTSTFYRYLSHHYIDFSKSSSCESVRIKQYFLNGKSRNFTVQFVN